MKQKIKQFLGGYLYVRLTGFSPERFLNLCMANQIILWDLKVLDNGYQFYVQTRDYRRVRPLVRKAGVHTRILRKCGLPFFLHRNRKRKPYAVGVSLFFLILFLMSRFIWNISIEGNRRFTDDMLLHYLDSTDIHYGSPKRKIDCSALEEAIRSQYPEILWVSARVSGTRLLIHLKENDVMGTIPVKEDSPRDLTADQAGTITRIVVRRGKAQVQPGDAVEPGQILVSGQIPIKNDADEVVNIQYVRADADIYAQREETCFERVSRLVTVRTRTGTVRNGMRIRLPGISLLGMLPLMGESEWELTGKSRQLALLKDFYLPVWIDRITARQYSRSERPRTEEELEEIKNQIHHQNMQNFMELGVHFIVNVVIILDKGSHWEIQSRFLLEERIGTGQNIEPDTELNRKQEEEIALRNECN